MVIMILKYVKALEEIDKHLAAHREFLDENFNIESLSVREDKIHVSVESSLLMLIA